MSAFRFAAACCGLMGAASCAGELGHLGRAPKFSEPGGDTGRLSAPAAAPDAPFVAYAPQATHPENTAGSLWSSGPDSLFGDRRAKGVGDIVTVVVEIDDEAEIRNRTERKRSGSDEITAPALLGVGTLAERVLPGAAGLDPAIDAGSSSTSKGEGTIRRNEKITLRVAAIVHGVMPNGHLVVQGSQEVRVNYELRDLQVAGIIRPEDISRANTITYDKIAEARISYGGRGQITDLQKARYGQQIIDLISPF